jgi:uncharacterized protein
MVVAVIRSRFRLPWSTSLKDKRAFLGSLKAKIAAKFQAAVAETGLLDDRSAAELGFALVGPDRMVLESACQKIRNFLEAEASDSLDGFELHLENL